jgi:hypothetical protein
VEGRKKKREKINGPISSPGASEELDETSR